MDSKKVLDHVMHVGKHVFSAPSKLFCMSKKKACAWTTKRQYHFRSCNIWTKINEYIEAIGGFSAGSKPFWKKYAAQHGTVILHWDLCVPVWVFNNSARCYAMRLLWDGSVFFRSAMQLRLSHMSAAAYPKAVAYFKWRVRITELWEVENVALGNRC